MRIAQKLCASRHNRIFLEARRPPQSAFPYNEHAPAGCGE
jgi:hypothetical protein